MKIHVFGFTILLKFRLWSQLTVPWKPHIAYLYTFTCTFCQQAESHVSKYCRSELKGKECIVCSGHMTIQANDEPD